MPKNGQPVSLKLSYITDKGLATAVSAIYDILKKYRHSMDVKVCESNGQNHYAELSITIHMK